jgi:hypothetical protein
MRFRGILDLMFFIGQDQGKITFLNLMLPIFGNQYSATFNYILHMLERVLVKGCVTARLYGKNTE